MDKSVNVTTSADAMKAAWAALLSGDTAERDRQCERARQLMGAEKYAGAVERVLGVDFYVTGSGVAVPTKRMAKAAGVIQ